MRSCGYCGGVGETLDGATCPACLGGVIGAYRRTHPVTGREFDFEHVCRTCKHFSVKTRLKVKQVCCALAPALDGETFGQQRDAFLACDRWQARS